jgi:hypothetical protein
MATESDHGHISAGHAPPQTCMAGGMPAPAGMIVRVRMAAEQPWHPDIAAPHRQSPHRGRLNRAHPWWVQSPLSGALIVGGGHCPRVAASAFASAFTRGYSSPARPAGFTARHQRRAGGMAAAVRRHGDRAALGMAGNIARHGTGPVGAATGCDKNRVAASSHPTPPAHVGVSKCGTRLAPSKNRGHASVGHATPPRPVSQQGHFFFGSVAAHFSASASLPDSFSEPT